MSFLRNWPSIWGNITQKSGSIMRQTTTLLLLLSTIWSPPLLADAWATQQRESFDSFTQLSKAQYSEFRDKRDAQFSRWLSEQWQEYDQFRGEVRDAAPKPTTQPAIDPAAHKAARRKLNPAAARATPALPKTLRPEGVQYRALTLNFFGHDVAIQYDDALAKVQLSSTDKGAIKTAWEQLAHAPHEPTLYSLNHYREKLALSDWATTRLVEQLSHALHDDANSRALLCWFLLAKLGYRVRAGLSDEKLQVLFSPAQKVYALAYYLIDGERYHLLYGEADGKLHTHQGEFDTSAAPLDLRFSRSVLSNPPASRRDIHFRGSTLTIDYDENRIALFATHPQIDLQHYFTAQPAEITATSLKKQLTPLLQGMSELEKVSLLLAFVQLGLAYKLDDEQFGEENYLLPEETLHYSAADCEDRAILFAWLVRELVGTPVIGLSYPGHVSTAVSLATPPPDSTRPIKYEGGNYWPADPTYIGAGVGQLMPQHRTATVEIIRAATTR
jgi:hypothetical protein